MKTKLPVPFQLKSLIVCFLSFELGSDSKCKILRYLFCQRCGNKNLVALEFLKYKYMFLSIK